MTDRKAATAAVLDDMVAGIMGKKAEKAAKLTPVGTEASKFPRDVPGQLMAAEEMKAIATHLRNNAATLIEIANGLDVLTGEPSAVIEDAKRRMEVEQRLKEREADRRVADAAAAEAGDKRAQVRVAAAVEDEESFADRQRRIADEAQRAIFGWSCPTHGNDQVLDRTSPKGRQYRVCAVPNCKEFER